jgi:hypothetical protein
MRRQLLPMEIPSNLQGLVPFGYMAVQLHTVSCVDIFFNIKWDDVGYDYGIRCTNNTS